MIVGAISERRKFWQTLGRLRLRLNQFIQRERDFSNRFCRSFSHQERLRATRAVERYLDTVGFYAHVRARASKFEDVRESSGPRALWSSDRFVPQMSRSELQIQLFTAQHSHYAHAVFLSICVSVVNKGRPDQIPKLVIRVRFPSPAPS